MYSGVPTLLKMEDEVNFVGLGGGRRIVYREQGVLRKNAANRSLLVLHGLGSSHVAGIPSKHFRAVVYTRTLYSVIGHFLLILRLFKDALFKYGLVTTN